MCRPRFCSPSLSEQNLGWIQICNPDYSSPCEWGLSGQGEMEVSTSNKPTTSVRNSWWWYWSQMPSCILLHTLQNYMLTLCLLACSIGIMAVSPPMKDTSLLSTFTHFIGLCTAPLHGQIRALVPQLPYCDWHWNTWCLQTMPCGSSWFHDYKNSRNSIR